MTTQIPSGYELTRTTPTFDNDSVPAGLLNAHQVADNVWGRLVVHTGTVTFIFDDEPDAPILISDGGHVVIPPSRRHHLELDGPATLAVEFYRSQKRSADDHNLESTGLAVDPESPTDPA